MVKTIKDHFEKMVQRMHGRDISDVSDLTKDFEKKTKINY